jgi:20S proteasome subunit beta 4
MMFSLFDMHWKPKMSLAEVKELCKKCLAEVRHRLVVAPPEFLFKVVDKDGVRIITLDD